MPIPTIPRRAGKRNLGAAAGRVISFWEDPDEGEGAPGWGGTATTGGRDGRLPRHAPQTNRRGAKGGHDLGAGPTADLRAILVKGHSAYPRGLVLHAPVVAQEAQ